MAITDDWDVSPGTVVGIFFFFFIIFLVGGLYMLLKKPNDNNMKSNWNNPKECVKDCLNTNPGLSEFNCRKTCGDYNVSCFNQCVGPKYPGKDKVDLCYNQCM